MPRHILHSLVLNASCYSNNLLEKSFNILIIIAHHSRVCHSSKHGTMRENDRKWETTYRWTYKVLYLYPLKGQFNVWRCDIKTVKESSSLKHRTENRKIAGSSPDATLLSFGKAFIYIYHSPPRCWMDTGRTGFLECCKHRKRSPTSSTAGEIMKYLEYISWWRWALLTFPKLLSIYLVQSIIHNGIFYLNMCVSS